MADQFPDEVLQRLMDLLTDSSGVAHGSVRLPTERELASQLDVSRATLRERLQMLETLGALRRTQGSGTYVEMPSSSVLRVYFDLAVRVGAARLGELQQAREIIEVEAAALAAERRDDADVARLERLVERLIYGPSIEAGDEADFQFHLDVVHMAGNAVLSLMVEGMARVLRELLADRRRVVREAERRAPTESGVSPNDRVHLDVLAAIRAQDPDEASRAMREHFQLWRDASARLGAEGPSPATQSKASRSGSRDGSTGSARHAEDDP